MSDVGVLRGVRPLGGDPVDLRVVDGVVAEVRPAAPTSADGRAGPDGTAGAGPVRGCVLLPAFVDLHTHLREPGGEDAETVATGTRAAAAGGYGTVFAMANTDPVVDDPDRLAAARRMIGRSAVTGVHQICSITEGLGGTRLSPVAELAAAGVRIFSDDGRCVDDAGVMRDALAQAAEHDVVLAQHAQCGAIAGEGQVDAGPTADALGVPGWPAVAESVIVARDVLLAEEAGAHLHVCHVSDRTTLDVVRWAKSRGVRVTAEVTPHHLLLTHELAELGDPRYKVNPPLRSAEDVAALREGLLDGTIDAVATDHAPHPDRRKTGDWCDAAFGMTGLETALAVVAHALGETGALTWDLIADVMSRRPARIGGLTEVGPDPVAVGAPATFALVRTGAWTVDTARRYSRSANSPFVGMELGHDVVATVIDGRVVHGPADTVARASEASRPVGDV